MSNDPRTRDPERTRDAILRAAELEFLQHGLRGTTVSAIAKRAGVTKSLIHHHFGAKLELWRVVKSRRMTEHAEEQLRLLGSEPLDESLAVRSMEAYFRFLQQNPEMIRLLAWMHIEQDVEDFGDNTKQLLDIGITKFAEGQQIGMIRADLEPRLILAAYIGLVQHWFQDRELFISCHGADMPRAQLDEAYLRTMLAIFLDGIRAR